MSFVGQDVLRGQAMDSIKSRVGGRNSPVFSDPTEGLGIRFDEFRLGDIGRPNLNIDLPRAVHLDFVDVVERGILVG